MITYKKKRIPFGAFDDLELACLVAVEAREKLYSNCSFEESLV